MDDDQIRLLIENIDDGNTEFDAIDGSDEEGVDEVEYISHNSDSEQSLDGDYEDNGTYLFSNWSNGPQFIGKDGKTFWKYCPPPKNNRIRRHNIVRHIPGVKGLAKNANSVEESWNLFFPDSILEQIVTYTNIYLDRIRPKFDRSRDARPTSLTEIKALIGLLYLAGVHQSSHVNIKDLWAMDGTGIEYFRLSMGMNRFYLLLRAIRFDDITTRAMRQSVDNLAPIRSFFEDFVRRCQDYYELNNYVTIDEMLESFRGRCRFRQYIPNKPAKYGLKIIALVDSNTYYSYNLEIYAGKQPNGPYHVNNSACSVVERLIRPISGSGRNITCDNWFSSIPLAEDLLNNHNLTMVGILRKNKREIPPIFVQKLKERPNESSIFGFKKNMTLVSYKPKANKIVLVISTMHNDDSIDTDCARSKPEMIKFYNSTKGGVDTVDQMKGKYSVSRNSRRWPLTIFFSVLNIAGINSQIIYASNTNAKIVRREYLKCLSKALIYKYMLERVQIKNIPMHVKVRIREITNAIEEPVQKTSNAPGRCAFCNWKKNRKTSNLCNECQSYICKEHTAPSICQNCSQRTMEDDFFLE